MFVFRVTVEIEKDVNGVLEYSPCYQQLVADLNIRNLIGLVNSEPEVFETFPTGEIDVSPSSI